VQLLPDPPIFETTRRGAIAQLGERLLCKQEVIGSIPIGSTNFEPLTTCNQEFFEATSVRSVCSLTIRKFFCFDAHVQAMNIVD
jgi:hypothetical protein